MEFVIDANILFSALIKDGLTRKLLLYDELILYAPKFILEEFFDKLIELSEKTEVDEITLTKKSQELISLSNIKIIPNEELQDYLEKAKQVSPDKDDVIYFALALKLNCSIWSNDKKLKEQNTINIYSTDELIEKIKVN